MSTRRGFLKLLGLAAPAAALGLAVLPTEEVGYRMYHKAVVRDKNWMKAKKGEQWGTWWKDSWQDTLEQRQQKVADFVHANKITCYDYRLVTPSDTGFCDDMPYTAIKWWKT